MSHHHAIALWVSVGTTLFVALAASALAIHNDWRQRRAKRPANERRRF